MGRYSSVQSYSDNNPNMRAVSHEAATASVSSNAVLKTEKVHNPYGSTAGAGSGEFHIYRHARAREAQRLKALDEEEKEQLEQNEFNAQIDAWKREEEDRLNKKRKKRMRNKAAKTRKKNMNLSGVIREEEGRNNEDGEGLTCFDDEFEYTPVHKLNTGDQIGEEKKAENDATIINEAKTSKGDKITDNKDQSIKEKSDADEATEEQPSLQFKNDGSFLEMMKKMQGNK